MKKTMLLLPLLFSVNAFALENPCANGCTLQQINAYNKANYKTTEQLIRAQEESEAEDYRIWVEEHREAQARADALPVIKKEAGQTYETCASRVYEKASEIIGDNAKNYIIVTVEGDDLDNCNVTIDVKTFGEACEYLSELSAIAKPHFTTAEYCRFLAEEMEVLKDYRDIVATPAFTQSVQLERDARLMPIYKKHDENVSKLLHNWEQQQKQKQK
ncbi:hypothetical protein OQB66_00960 [Pseudomonas syringae]|uniref:hypothetical protein n=1 Tax=Pseudomonas syringae TaxID=317 RepID=UPI00224A51C8|nr:hypothetical protein [Pseudomonas syringae]UZS72944.1 hypothetical protein OQB66_00960 [Pseudomonas syringae]